MVSVPGYGRPGKSDGNLNGRDRYELGSTAWATALRTRYGPYLDDNGNPSYAGRGGTPTGSLACWMAHGAHGTLGRVLETEAEPSSISSTSSTPRSGHRDLDALSPVQSDTEAAPSEAAAARHSHQCTHAMSSAAAYTTPTLARRQQACFYEFFDRATARVRQFRGQLPAVTLAAKNPFFRGRALSGVTRCRGDNTSAIW